MDNMIGKLISEKQFAQLKEALLVIADENGKSYALTLLTHGYNTTTLTKLQYQEIFKAIQEQPYDASTVHS